MQGGIVMKPKYWLMSFFVSLTLASTIMNIYSFTYGFNPQANPISILCFLALFTFALMTGMNCVFEGIYSEMKEVS